MYDCAHCERNPGLKSALGHDGPPTLYPSNLVTGEKFTRCPVRTIQLTRAADPALVEEVERHRVELYPLYRDKGLLIAGGGVGDQPNRYMAYMETIAALEASAKAVWDREHAPTGDEE